MDRLLAVALILSVVSTQEALGSVKTIPLKKLAVPVRRFLADYTPVETSDSEQLVNSGNDDLSYTGEIEIGGQNISVLFDTGSSDLWVWADRPNGYQPDDTFGTTCNPCERTTCPDCKWNDTYEGGWVAGEVGEDQVSLGSSQKSMYLGAATSSAGSGFNQLGGICGLAFNALARYTIPVMSSTIEKFAFYLTSGQQNYLTIGGYDPSLCANEDCAIETIRVQKTNNEFAWWALGLSSVSVDDNEVFKGDKTQIIVDSGTSLIQLDSDSFSDVMSNLVDGTDCRLESCIGTELYACKQGDLSTLRNLTFSVAGADGSGFDLTISPDEYTEDSSLYGCRGDFLVMIFGGHINGGINWILGDVFMRAFSPVYFDATDSDGPVLGFSTTNAGNVKVSAASSIRILEIVAAICFLVALGLAM